MNQLDLTSTDERTIIDFSKWHIEGISLIGHYKYNHVHPQLTRHNHPNMIEVVYCAKGQQAYEVNGQLYKIKGGDVFITMPDEFHSSAGYPEDKGELFWIIIDITNDKFLNYVNEEAHAFRQVISLIPNRHFEGSPSMKKVLERIVTFHSFESLNLLQQITIKHHLNDFLLELIERGYRETATIKMESLQKVLGYIDENIQKIISISELAALVHLSESRFKAWFKEKTGVPPLEFVLRKKITYAKELLMRGDKTVADVAFHLEFSSPQYFAKVFKKFTGQSPKTVKITA